MGGEERGKLLTGLQGVLGVLWIDLTLSAGGVLCAMIEERSKSSERGAKEGHKDGEESGGVTQGESTWNVQLGQRLRAEL